MVIVLMAFTVMINGVDNNDCDGMVNKDWIDAGPVFGIGSEKAYYPSVIKDDDLFSGHGDSVRYKMWYSGAKLTTSNDGVNWSLGVSLTGLTNPNHVVVKYYPGGFQCTGPSTCYYRIWYGNVNIWPYPGSTADDVIKVIRYAESADGISWHNDQPITQGIPNLLTNAYSDWNRGTYGPLDVLYENSQFIMYYDGTVSGDESIGIAYSTDGKHWVGYDKDSDGKADPVLSGSDQGNIGGSESWYSKREGTVCAINTLDYNSRATVLHLDDIWHMWYSAGYSTMHGGIGYATSTDGINWVKDFNNPIFTNCDGMAYRDRRAYTPAVIIDDGMLRMWYSCKGDATNLGGDINDYMICIAQRLAYPRMLKNEAIATLEAAKTGDKKIGDKLDKAIKNINKSLNPKLWVDDSHLNPEIEEGKEVFDKEKTAVGEGDGLMELMRKSDTPQEVKDACQAAINNLITADRLLAETAIQDAKCSYGKQDEINKAEEKAAKAQEDYNKGNYDKAIEHYKHAWEHSQKALGYK